MYSFYEQDWPEDVVITDNLNEIIDMVYDCVTAEYEEKNAEEVMLDMAEYGLDIVNFWSTDLPDYFENLKAYADEVLEVTITKTEE